jgi:phage terminase large subunit
VSAPRRQVFVDLEQRDWQRPLVQAFRDGIRHAIVIAHRRAGKDRVSLFVELFEALKQRCEVWHALPEQEHARKVIWDAITGDGERLIDVAFPPSIRAGPPNASEMKITFTNGSLWRLVGADRINALVGANPKHVTFSEFALTNPKAREFIRPILVENGGSELMISTPRGYNHCFNVWKAAQSNPNWYAAIHPVSETRLVSLDLLEEERRTMPDELYRQEWECDFSAANVGAILGRYVEELEKKGWLDCDEACYDASMAVDVSSDIGFRDAAAFWFWQRQHGGYHLVDYMEDTGMDAEEWIERLRTTPYRLGTLWLPHDARAKTFQSRRTVVDTFLSAGISERVRVVPQGKIADRVNAARVVLRRCRFAPACAHGVQMLREWSFRYDDERKDFSAEPEHNYASHGADAFSYGAQVMSVTEPAPVAVNPHRDIGTPAHYAFRLDDLVNDPDINPALGEGRRRHGRY